METVVIQENPASESKLRREPEGMTLNETNSGAEVKVIKFLFKMIFISFSWFTYYTSICKVVGNIENMLNFCCIQNCINDLLSALWA